MEIFNNTTNVVKDDLQKTIRSGSKVSIAAACFSIYAFQELKEQLESCEELRFLFTSPTFVAEKTPKERREFYIPRLQREKSLYGTEFEVRLRNELKQKAVARECAQWMRRKAKFRSNTTRDSMNNFMLVSDGDETYAYSPMNSFTTVDLGCERGNNMTNIVVRVESPESTQFLQTFNQVWNDKEKLKDVTGEVIDMISTVYQENPPEIIYYMTLYNIFSEFLEDISEDVLPNEATGFKDSVIWNKLFNFQKDAALGIINKLEQYNGCILADSVGLGKTFTALAVIKYYEGRNKNVLVLCPKKLSENWMTYRGNLINNPLAKDRFRYDVLYHTDLSRNSGNTAVGLPIDRINWGNYDLVVIDESHNFRNGNGTDSQGGEKENRYMRLMNRVIKPGVKTKVLMLSATPVNNRFYDLRNQLALAYGGDPEEINGKLKTKSDIDTIFRQAQAVYNTWCKLPEAQRTTDHLLASLDYDFFEVLDSVTIARSRKHIQTYYDVTDIGSFPKRLKPVSLRPKLTNRKAAINYKEVIELLTALHLTIYTPTVYIQPSKLHKYLDEKETEKFRMGREIGIQRLMSINLLKRMESSVHSFLLTVKRICDYLYDTSQTIEAFRNGGSGNLDEMTDLSGEAADFDDDDQNTDFFGVGKKVRIDLRDMDYLSWKRDIDEDIGTLSLLIGMVEDITPQYDYKLSELLRVIREKVEKPINPGNKKVLIFTAFSDTAEYLYEHVSGMAKTQLGLNTALITGAVDGKTTIPGFKAEMNHVLTCFSPKSKDRDVLVPQGHGGHRHPDRDGLHLRGAEPAGLRLLHQLRHPLEPRAHHPALRTNRPHRQPQRGDPARQLLARPRLGRIYPAQVTRRGKDAYLRHDLDGRRQPNRPRGEGRPRIPPQPAEKAAGGGRRPGGYDERRVHHGPGTERVPHGSNRLQEGARGHRPHAVRHPHGREGRQARRDLRPEERQQAGQHPEPEQSSPLLHGLRRHGRRGGHQPPTAEGHAGHDAPSRTGKIRAGQGALRKVQQGDGRRPEHGPHIEAAGGCDHVRHRRQGRR